MKIEPKDHIRDHRIEEARLNGDEELDLTGLELVELPAAIGELPRLRVLHLERNRLTALPESIGRLGELRVLNLFGNRLISLPESIGDLGQLGYLAVGSNELAFLPNSIGHLSKLRQLSADWNRLEALPESIVLLAEIEYLILNGNRLTALPKSIGQLKNLRFVFLRDNKLSELPQSMAHLSKLDGLELHGNSALNLPPEIMNARPPSTILQYYFKSRRGPTRPLGEAKILIVGQGGTGKTSLVKRLIHNEYDPHESKTEGIHIAQWEVPDKAATEGGGSSIRLNVWDFGGQEIMHATHQFFLTKRSLYIVVIDARKGENEGNIHYWLKLIQSYGGDAPVLVVINKHEPPNLLDLNETRLHLDYAPNLKGFLKISCKTGDGIERLRAAIEAEVSALPHVHDVVPEAYFKVKERLSEAAQSCNFIDFGEYESICRDSGVQEKPHQEILIRFLHDLGTVLNFDDPTSPFPFRDTNILNPEWVTGGVYKILNSNALMQREGSLDIADLGTILDDHVCYPPERHKFIVEMMRRFELCFEFPESAGRRMLVPELLRPNEPDLGWNAEGALNFEYHYNVLPSGLISRFIVKMHHNLTARPTYWRSGVVLEIDGCRTLVRADTQAGRIYVSIQGRKGGRRSALSVVRDAFKAIHGTIPKLDAKEKVPLPDKPSVVVDYLHLLRLEEEGDASFLPEGADKKYGVQDLLNGVEERSRREEKRRQDGLEKIGDRRVQTRRKAAARAAEEEAAVKRPSIPAMFYVIAFVVVLAGFSVASTYVPVGSLIPVLIATILVLPVLGALVLKNDDRLKDESFLAIVKDAYAALPFLRAGSGKNAPSGGEREPSNGGEEPELPEGEEAKPKLPGGEGPRPKLSEGEGPRPKLQEKNRT